MVEDKTRRMAFSPCRSLSRRRNPPGLTRPSIGIALAAIVVLAIVSAIGYRHLTRPAPSSEAPIPLANAGIEPVSERPAPEVNQPPRTEDESVVVAVNTEFDPSMIRTITIGEPSDGVTTVDLSTPDAAVHSVLTLVDEKTTDQLGQCFAEGMEVPANGLYPRYLGHPIALVDVVEDGETATVTWEAAVHTAFTHQGQDRAPGETVTLTSRLIRVDDLWRLVKFDE